MKVRMQASSANRLAALRLLMDMPSAKIVIGPIEVEMKIDRWIVRSGDQVTRYDTEEGMMDAVRMLLK